VDIHRGEWGVNGERDSLSKILHTEKISWSQLKTFFRKKIVSQIYFLSSSEASRRV
jgi:hypothetical protein